MGVISMVMKNSACARLRLDMLSTAKAIVVKGPRPREHARNHVSAFKTAFQPRSLTLYVQKQQEVYQTSKVLLYPPETVGRANTSWHILGFGGVLDHPA